MSAPLLQLALPALCGAPALLGHMVPPPPLPPLTTAAPSGAKTEREAIEGVQQVRTSTNFAVKWGSSAGISEQVALDLLDDLETIWFVEIDEMGHPEPFGADRYLVNVYLESAGLIWRSDAGSFELTGSGTSGYFYSDPDGHPMLVISQSSLADRDYAAMVGSHEFFHAVQSGLGSYAYSGTSAWFWEATATWISAEVFPDETAYSAFLFGYALLPQLPVDFFDYPDTGALQEYHQYGAFIVPRYLTEHVADWTIVRDAWVSPDPGGDPVAALDSALAAWDTTVADQLVDVAAANTTWSVYAHGDAYRENVETYGPYYSDGAAQVDSWSGTGTDGWVAAPKDSLPRSYGTNAVELRSPDAGPLYVAVQTRDSDTDGSDDEGGETWTSRVVIDTDGVAQVHELVLDDGEGTLELTLTGQEDAVYLVVAVTDEARDDDDSFAWRYRLEAGEGAGEEPDTGAGGSDTAGSQEIGEGQPRARACGCASSASSGGLSLLFLAPLLVLTRRRR